MQSLTIIIENPTTEKLPVVLFTKEFKPHFLGMAAPKFNLDETKLSITCKEMDYRELLDIIDSVDKVVFDLNYSAITKDQSKEEMIIGYDNRKGTVNSNVFNISDMANNLQENYYPLSCPDFEFGLNKDSICSFEVLPNERIELKFAEFKDFVNRNTTKELNNIPSQNIIIDLDGNQSRLEE